MTAVSTAGTAPRPRLPRARLRARIVLAGLSGSSFPFSAFLSGALFTAVPGIIAQLVLIPLIITALQKAKVLE